MTTPISRARLQTHWALQVPAAVASALVPSEDDDSHSNFGWSEPDRAFLSHPLKVLPELSHVQIGLRPVDMCVVLVDARGGAAELSLVGRALPAAIEAVREGLKPLVGGDLPATPLRDYELPSHPVGDGAAFELGDEAPVASIVALFETFTRVFASVEERLRRELADDPSAIVPGSSLDAARIWPHHFDLGGLLNLGDQLAQSDRASRDPRQAESPSDRSVGYGLSLGDETFTLPYLYINPYPPPEAAPAVTTQLGQWNRIGFSGFVLHSRELSQKGDLELAVAVGSLLVELGSERSTAS